MAKTYSVLISRPGSCGGGINPKKFEDAILNKAKEGWKLSHTQQVVGKVCGCFPEYQLWAIFEKDL